MLFRHDLCILLCCWTELDCTVLQKMCKSCFQTHITMYLAWHTAGQVIWLLKDMMQLCEIFLCPISFHNEHLLHVIWGRRTIYINLTWNEIGQHRKDERTGMRRRQEMPESYTVQVVIKALMKDNGGRAENVQSMKNGGIEGRWTSDYLSKFAVNNCIFLSDNKEIGL